MPPPGYSQPQSIATRLSSVDTWSAMTMTNAEVSTAVPPSAASGAFIDGGFVTVGVRATFDVIEPSTASPLATVVSAQALTGH
jgi:hypothetical protein